MILIFSASKKTTSSKLFTAILGLTFLGILCPSTFSYLLKNVLSTFSSFLFYSIFLNAFYLSLFTFSVSLFFFDSSSWFWSWGITSKCELAMIKKRKEIIKIWDQNQLSYILDIWYKYKRNNKFFFNAGNRAKTVDNSLWKQSLCESIDSDSFRWTKIICKSIFFDVCDWVKNSLEWVWCIKY